MTCVAERRVGNQIYNFLRETFFHENTIIVSLNGEKSNLKSIVFTCVSIKISDHSTDSNVITPIIMSDKNFSVSWNL